MAVSNTADLFYSLFNTFLYLAILVGGVVFAVMFYLIIKYRERGVSTSEPEDAPTLGRIPHARGKLRTLLISVTLSTIILGVLIFGTFSAIDRIQAPPQGTLRVQVIGFQFDWKFVYPSGHVEVSGPGRLSQLRVPMNESIILDVTSVDVQHNFYIIDFKIKTDAIPGRTNTIWFIANEPGEYAIQCYELCGVGHFNMRATLLVMQPSDFQDW